MCGLSYCPHVCAKVGHHRGKDTAEHVLSLYSCQNA